MILTENMKRRLWLMYCSALFFWALNAYILLGQWFNEGTIFAREIDGRPHVSDFINTYAAGVLARRCIAAAQAGAGADSVDIYDMKVQSALHLQLVAPVVPERPFYNQYPPVMFVMFLPLAFTEMKWAWIVWNAASALAMGLAVWFTIIPRVKHPFAKAFVLVSFFTCYPAWLSFELGQTSLFLLPLLLFYFHALRNKRHIVAGVLAGLMTVKLQYAPLLVAVGTALGGLKFLLGFGGMGGLLVALCTAVLGWGNIMRFPHALLWHEGSTQTSGVSPELMQNLRGALVLFAGDSRVVHIVVAAVALITPIVLFLLWRRLRASVEADQFAFDRMAAFTLLTMLATSPHTHIQDYIIAVCAGAWIWIWSNAGRCFASKEGKMLKLLIVSFPAASWMYFFLLPLFKLVKIQPFFLWALAVALLIARCSKSSSPAEQAEHRTG